MKLHIFIATALLAELLTGCGSSKETEKTKAAEKASILDEYEAQFRPSDYDMDAKVFLSELKGEKEPKTTTDETASVDLTVLASGFRVQMLATTDIDEANAKKAEAEAAFIGEWFYLTFDPPTYKLRAGNFLTRDDADAFAKYLQESGYADAWVVPEKVLKNIQARPVAPIEPPERQ